MYLEDFLEYFFLEIYFLFAGDIYYHCGEPEKAFRYWQIAQKKGGTDTGTLDKKIKQKKYVK